MDRSPGDTRSDAQLLSAHSAGDRRAFAVLFLRHRARLHRVARRRSRCAEDADDAVQEAMLAAHRAAGAFRHDAAVSSWLHRIVINACMDGLRRNPSPVAGLPGDHPVADHSSGVETVLAVRRALLALPAAQRAAVLAVDMLGYSVAEAAGLLGVAEGTIKSRRARARARLAVTLAHLRPRTDAPDGPGPAH